MKKGLSPWLKHVMETKRKMGSGASLGAAMKKAASTYRHKKKGGAFEQGETSEAAADTAEAKLSAEPEYESEEEEKEEKGGRRRKTRRHRGGRTRRTRTRRHR